MEQNLVAKEKFVYQVSSEIEAITALLGAGFAGRKAMTATAGPGLSLMSEGLGLGWMAEIPCVVVDVQRGGPATGLPTKTEQSDLLACFHPAHGDISIPVIAPGSVEECFYATVSAFNWAERYQGPVILMNEMSMAERAQNIPMPELGKLQVVNRSIYNGSNGYMRYAGDSVSPMPIPGHPGSYIANGSEHDPSGDTTHLASRHIEMTQRRFNKLKLLTNGTYESLNKEAPITIMPWGGTKGPSLEAYNLLAKQTTSLSWFYTMFLNPLPETLLTQLRKKELVIVPELNFMGQWSSILRSHGINAISITQYTGLPFKVEDLANRILDVVQSHEKRTVQT
jgi:2-oxoglutarate ferredoxin oxidoreductase subunit alpha